MGRDMAGFEHLRVVWVKSIHGYIRYLYVGRGDTEELGTVRAEKAVVVHVCVYDV